MGMLKYEQLAVFSIHEHSVIEGKLKLCLQDQRSNVWRNAATIVATCFRRTPCLPVLSPCKTCLVAEAHVTAHPISTVCDNCVLAACPLSLAEKTVIAVKHYYIMFTYDLTKYDKVITPY